MRTSETDPLRVGWLSVPGGRGRLGVTLAPGKHATSAFGAAWQRDLDTDLAALSAEGTQVLVSLLEDEEAAFLRIPTLFSAAAARGLEVCRLPVPDGGVPSLPAARELVARIVGRLAAGQTVVVHCRGGLGRAPTLAGCVLVALGVAPEAALADLVRARGRGVPETAAQRAFVQAFSPSEPSAHTAPLDYEARVLGAIFGAAVGDALGQPTEFLSMPQIHARFGPMGIREPVLSARTAEAGEHAMFTDDTQMAVAVLRTLVALPPTTCARGDLDDVMIPLGRAFVAWSELPDLGVRAPGNACLAGCRALAAGVAWAEAGGATAGGCGSVMRAYPLGLIAPGDRERAIELAVAQSRLTHNDPIALAASAAMAAGMVAVLRDATVAEVATEMIAAAGRYSVETAAMLQRALDEAQAGVDPAVVFDRLRGWAAHEAIAAGLYTFVKFPDDVVAAVRLGANTPGDSDSIATLAGALVGARVGFSALPERWREVIEDRDELLSLGRALVASVEAQVR
jgi:ADP-ribosyl-[dinitrogen reductase] hydrolase